MFRGRVFRTVIVMGLTASLVATPSVAATSSDRGGRPADPPIAFVSGPGTVYYNQNPSYTCDIVYQAPYPGIYNIYYNFFMTSDIFSAYAPTNLSVSGPIGLSGWFGGYDFIALESAWETTGSATVFILFQTEEKVSSYDRVTRVNLYRYVSCGTGYGHNGGDSDVPFQIHSLSE